MKTPKLPERPRANVKEKTRGAVLVSAARGAERSRITCSRKRNVPITLASVGNGKKTV